MIIAVALLPFLATWMGIAPQYLWLAVLYCTLLPTMGAATPSGVLRTLDRFDLLSWAGTVTPIARAVLAATAFFAGASFPVYVGIWYATDLVGDLYTWFVAVRELQRRDLLQGIRPTLRPTTLPGAWRFAIHVNLAISVSTVWGPIARLVVGGLLGPAGAGLFRVASALADAAQKPADLLSKAFYPEVVRMDLSSKKPWNLMLRGSALASLFALVAILVLLIGGKPLIALFLGKDFVGAYAPLVVLVVVPFIGIFSFPLVPMLYALGQSAGPLKAKILGSAVFFLSIAPLSWKWGVIGAAIAIVLGTITNVGALAFQLQSEYRRVRSA
jgi:O-antigen/teichoic acid export membrane protein